MRELARLPPDLHVNGRQVMDTGTLTTVINYTLDLPASQQMLKVVPSTRANSIYFRNKFCNVWGFDAIMDFIQQQRQM